MCMASYARDIIPDVFARQPDLTSEFVLNNVLGADPLDGSATATFAKDPQNAAPGLRPCAKCLYYNCTCEVDDEPEPEAEQDDYRSSDENDKLEFDALEYVADSLEQLIEAVENALENNMPEMAAQYLSLIGEHIMDISPQKMAHLTNLAYQTESALEASGQSTHLLNAYTASADGMDLRLVGDMHSDAADLSVNTGPSFGIFVSGQSATNAGLAGLSGGPSGPGGGLGGAAA